MLPSSLCNCYVVFLLPIKCTLLYTLALYFYNFKFATKALNSFNFKYSTYVSKSVCDLWSFSERVDIYMLVTWRYTLYCISNEYGSLIYLVSLSETISKNSKISIYIVLSFTCFLSKLCLLLHRWSPGWTCAPKKLFLVRVPFVRTWLSQLLDLHLIR